MSGTYGSKGAPDEQSSGATRRKGRALRTETTINDTRDFRIGKRLTNLPALREIGLSANRRLLGAQRLSHNPIRAAEAFTAVQRTDPHRTGGRVAGLRLGDRRAHALLQALLMFRLPQTDSLNRDLRGLLAELLASTCERDHRRADGLRPKTAPRPRADHPCPAQPPLPAHRYRTATTPCFSTTSTTRLLLPGLAHLADPDPPAPSPLRTAARNYQRALEHFTQEAGLAA